MTNDVVYFYHVDHIGTPIMMTDENGNIVWQAEYMPFGEVHSITGTINNNLRFPGQYYDSETGLNQNWHRDYKAEVGRYMQFDPILHPVNGQRKCSKNKNISIPSFESLLTKPQNLNPYIYALSNPLINIDPTGLACGTKDLDRYIPDSFAGFDFTSACIIHDKCYEDCYRTKSECDNQFLSNMVKECLTSFSAPQCMYASVIYYSAVAVGGQRAYDDARKGKCCK